MSKSTKNEIIKSLTLQKEIFGDELFIPKKKRTTRVVKEPSTPFAEQELFPVEKEDWEKTTSLNELEREEVYIGNVVKCRPPENRTPLPDEMETCMPYLKKQCELIKPKLILCLGLTAARGLLKKRESLGDLRGKVFEYEGAKVMVTYHSAALLRNPNWKKDCWEDLKKFRKLYDAP